MPRVVHFEIPADDPERTAGFYRDLFGWQAQDAGVGFPYFLVTTGEDTEPGINGAVMGRGGTANTVTNTVGVDNLDATLAKVKELGGEVVTDIQEIPDVGTFAYCKDIEGNLFGVIQPPAG